MTSSIRAKSAERTAASVRSWIWIVQSGTRGACIAMSRAISSWRSSERISATIVGLMRTLLRQLEIARDMAMHAPLVPDWTIDIHTRTLAAVRAADFPLIDTVMDEHLAQLEQIWERETGRGLVRPLPDFLQPVAERSRALRAG